MGDNLLEAFWLLIVGMGSAFFVLFLIGVCGRFLIIWVNAGEKTAAYADSSAMEEKRQLNAVHVAVLTAAVEELTRGEGNIQHIQKIES